jgi:RNA methyltransferase, TrmH family
MLVKSQVKYIQSLSQKKLRDEESVFVAEGPKIINELLRASNVQFRQLFAVESWINANQELLNVKPGGQVIAIDEKELERISFLKTPNDVLGIFQKPSFNAPILKGAVSLLLDSIQDPGNMGTILRCADWFGIQTIICSEECADVFAPKVIQSTMGSISRVQVLYADPLQFLANHAGLPLYAAVLGGNDISSFKKIKEGIILIGNESKGLRDAILDLPVQRLTIPKKGGAESLNAAIATGIILSHLT